jgi:hypothetical protein
VYQLVGSTLTLMTEGLDYSVTGVGNASGGTVVFTVVPPSVPSGTGSIVLRRAVPMTQGTHYVANDAFPESTHEAALDKLTMLVQQVVDETSLAVKVPINYTGDTSDLLTQVQEALTDAELAAFAAQTAETAAAASAGAASGSAASAAQSAIDAQAAVGGVKVTTTDTTPGVLESKILAGLGLTSSIQNPTGNATVTFSSVGATILLASKLGAL